MPENILFVFFVSFLSSVKYVVYLGVKSIYLIITEMIPVITNCQLALMDCLGYQLFELKGFFMSSILSVLLVVSNISL